MRDARRVSALPLIATLISTLISTVGCVFGATLAGCSGCSKTDETAPAVPAPSALGPSAAGPAGTVWHFAVDPKSRTEVEMPGVTEHIRAETTAAAGELDVVPTDLGRSRGVVRIDLETFSTHTFGTDDDAAQTRHARTWLEVSQPDAGDPTMRWANLAIRSIDGLSAADLTKVAPSEDGAEEVRTVTMTVHGELWVHGHKADKDDRVEVAFRYPRGAPATSRPSRIVIRSKEPLRVVLKEHDVRPRDPAGQLLAWSSKLVSKVAETADITAELEATPVP